MEPPIWTQHRTLYRCLRLQGKRAALADTNSNSGWGRVRSPSTAAARCGTPRGARSGAASAEWKGAAVAAAGSAYRFAFLVLTILFFLNTVHMYSMVNNISCHIHTLDTVCRGHAWRLLLLPTTPRDPSRTVLYTVIAEHLETFLASSRLIPMPRACPPMGNASFTTICSVVSSPMAFCAWDVTPASKSCCCPSVASGAGFVRRVRAGGWPRPRPTWSSASSPGCRRANGSCRCPSPCATGPHLTGSDRERSIRSSVPRSRSITSTKQSKAAWSGRRSTRDRSRLSSDSVAP